VVEGTLDGVVVEPEDSAGAGGHDHADFPIGRGRRRLVNVIVVALAALSIVGLVALWPRGGDAAVAPGTDQLPTANATVTDVLVGPCAGTTSEDAIDCFVISARMSNGPLRGQVGQFEQTIGAISPDITTGDRIRVAYDQATDPPLLYFYDFQRTTPLLWLGLLFALAVVLLGGWRGLGALCGLVVSLVVLIVFTLPSILEGQSPVAVALVSAAVIALVALYLAHGPTAHTAVAVLGTMAALVLTGLLAAVFVAATHLTGLTDENALILTALNGRISLTGIILAGIVIGSLGVLDDVTVTQVAAVGELIRAQPDLPPRPLFDAAIRIGRDHISSTVNTLVLAYAGAALPLLLLFTQAQRQVTDIATSEIVAVEIVQALVGSIGLVTAVPITTALAVWIHGRPTASSTSSGLPRPRSR
jgi:uncharacterized membrane protein